VTDLNPKLLKELALLASKYPPKDWEALAGRLEDPVWREQTRSALVALASVSRTARKAKGRRTREPGPAARVRDGLAKIRVDDAERAELLDEIWGKLRRRELLPTVATVRAFAEAIGSKGIEASRRDQAIAELMERIIELPAEQLEQRMRETVVDDRNLGAEYEQWVQLILGRRSESV
jgi:hypothetical protein